MFALLPASHERNQPKLLTTYTTLCANDQGNDNEYEFIEMEESELCLSMFYNTDFNRCKHL